MRIKSVFSLFLIIALFAVGACSNNKGKSEQSFSKIVKGLDKREGFFDVYVDKNGGRVFARLPKPDKNGLSLRMIHANSLNAGLGSNPVGLDRGLTTSGQILAFRMVGGKLIAEVENWSYRASADNEFEKQSVKNSFAKSYIWDGSVKARAGNGDLLVDISGFLTLDHMNIRNQLRFADQGNFSLSKDRSFPEGDSALAFPDNVEIDAAMTFTNEQPGSEVRSTAADGRSFTLSLHHSFVRLPDDGYTPREYDPRTAAINVSFYDFSTKIQDPIQRHYARRFRLERSDDTLATGPVKKPIIYYVDPGAPEPIRSALIEGASWWAQAFAEAGFEDAYRVEILPEDAHPLDIRYNVIQWTHRQTRGWSYGGGISDPRTGEMLKAHVILGSQRVRQDRMIFEGLAGTSATGSGRDDDPLLISLARIRQLSAHEVGHTLGFAHNFAGSTIDRASVMDYPAPYVKVLEDGRMDFSQAYDVGLGAWDKFTVRWLYTQFSKNTDKKKALKSIVDRGYEQGLRYVSDAHARSRAAAHPHGSLWDNGSDPVLALNETLDVRRAALRNFDLSVIADDIPRAQLQEVLVPIYLYHRYQIDAAAKLVGGYYFNYAIAGDGLPFSTPVQPQTQRSAVEVLLKTLDPTELALPERVLVRLSPSGVGFNGPPGRPETFTSHLREVFDPLAAADAAASLTLGALLEPARLARLVEINRRNSQSPGVEELLAALNLKLFESTQEAQISNAAISRQIQTRFIVMLMNLTKNANTSHLVRSEIEAYLAVLQGELSDGLSGDNRDPASNHRAWLLTLISSHLNRDDITAPVLNRRADIPPGSPIGSTGFTPDDPSSSHFREECWHCDSRL